MSLQTALFHVGEGDDEDDYHRPTDILGTGLGRCEGASFLWGSGVFQVEANARDAACQGSYGSLAAGPKEERVDRGSYSRRFGVTVAFAALGMVCCLAVIAVHLSNADSNQNPDSHGAASSTTADTKLFASVLCNFKRAIRAPIPGDYGYLLLTQVGKHWTDLVDSQTGLVKHRWFHKHPSSKSATLLENGNLLYMAHWSPAPKDEKEYLFNENRDVAGMILELDWNSNVVKSCSFSNNTHVLHHDFIYLKNGNYLALAWKKVTLEDMEARGFSKQYSAYGWYVNYNERNGREKKEFLVDGIVELKSVPGKQECQTVWYWWTDDHVIQDIDPKLANYGVLKDNLQLIDIHLKDEIVASESSHLNSLDYDSELDQILVNSMSTAELYIIDHNTTIAEAASHKGGARDMGGDILFRWGNDKMFKGDRQMFNWHAHGARWIPKGENLTGAGNIVWFDNGHSIKLVGNEEDAKEFKKKHPGANVNKRTHNVMFPLTGKAKTLMEKTYYVDQPAAQEFKPTWDKINGSYMKNMNGSFLPEELAWNCHINSYDCKRFGNVQRLPNGDSLAVCGFGAPAAPPSSEVGAHWMIQILAQNCSVKWELINPYPLQIEGIVNKSAVPAYVQSFLSMTALEVDGMKVSWNGIFRADLYRASYPGLKERLEHNLMYDSEEACQAAAEQQVLASNFDYSAEALQKLFSKEHSSDSMWPDMVNDTDKK